MLVLIEGHVDILGVLEIHILIFTVEKLVGAKESGAQLEGPMPAGEAHIIS